VSVQARKRREKLCRLLLRDTGAFRATIENRHQQQRAVGRQSGNDFCLEMIRTKTRQCRRCCLSIRSKAGSPSDREIDANQKPVMSDHDKNLFIEQHKDGYAILRGGVKEPLAVEPTQDAAIEKARKLDPDAAIHVERVRNVEGGGRDKWRRV
jgi:hypothetical protein